MKLHNVNIGFLLISFGLLIMNIHSLNTYAPWNREHYTIAACTADNLPINSSFHIITREGEDIWVSDIEIGYWGRHYASDYSRKFIAPPDSLKVSYLSMREQKAYTGDFKLPSRIIDSLYNLTYTYQATFNRYGKNPVRGFRFIIGVGPQGVITVWMKGSYDYQKEIASFTAQETSKWEGLSGQELNDAILKMDYSHGTDSLLQNNIPFNVESWNQLHQKFAYYFCVDSNSDIKKVLMRFTNQDEEQFDFSEKDNVFIKSGIPYILYFNKVGDEYEGDFSYNDTMLTKRFNLLQHNLSTTDTIVIYLSGNLKDSSAHLIATHTGEFDLLNNTYYQ